MRGKTVPESVRADGFGDAVFLSQVLDNQENHLSGQSCATTIEEYNIGEFGFWSDVQSCAFDILEQNFQAGVADGDEPFLAALADNAQETVFSVDVADLQSNEFGNTQSAAVQHFNHGLVAVAIGLAEVDAVDHLLDFLNAQHFGKMSAQ